MKARRTLNGKFLLVLLAALLVIGVGTHFLHAYQVKRNGSILKDQSGIAESKKDYPKAIAYMRRYLALAPEDTDALAKFGELLLAQDQQSPNVGYLERAYYALDQVLRREPGRHDTRRQVVRVAMDYRLRRHQDALEHLEELQEAVGKDAELISLRARCHVALANFRKAREDYEEALTLPGCERDSYLELARLLRAPDVDVAIGESSRDALYKKADEVIEALLKAHGRQFQAQLGAAAYFARSTQLATPVEADKTRKRVSELIAEARRLAPDELDVILAYAHLHEETDPDAARVELRRGLELHAKDWRIYQALASFEISAKKPDNALDALRQGLAKLPGHLDLQWNLAHLLIRQGKVAEANQVIDRLDKQHFPRAELDYLAARVHFAEERWPAATRLLERATTSFTGRADQIKDWLSINLLQESTLLLAKCHENLGDADAAGAAYNRVVTRNPQSVAGHFGLARMEWAMGRYDMAAREYRYLMQMPQPPAQAWIECAQLLIDRNLKSLQPNWVEVEVLLEQADKLKPVPVEVNLARAEIKAGKNLYAEARRLLLKGHEDPQTRPVEVFVGESNLEQRQGNWEEALRILDKAEEKLGDRVELRMARCRLWGRRGGPEASRALEHLSLSLDKFKSDEQRRLLRAIAESYLVNDKVKQARAIWQRIVDKHKTDVGGRMALFDLALREKDDAAMSNLVREIKEIEEDRGTLWRFAQTLQLIGQYYRDKDPKKLAEANELLVVVRKQRINWGRIWVAQGEIKDLSEDYIGAIEDYRKAFTLGEQNPAAIRRAVQLLTKLGKYEEADSMLKRLRGQSSLLGDMDRVAAEIALFRHDPEQALKLAFNAVPADSKDYRDHLWLGQMYAAVGEKDKAHVKFRHAAKLAPEAPEVWVTLVVHVHQTHKNDKDSKEKTATIILEAEKHLPKEQATVALAYCHEFTGNKDRARELFQADLDAKPNDFVALKNMALFHLRHGQGKEARQKFEKILELKDLPATEQHAARRTLLFIIASGGNYRETSLALEKLEFLRPAKDGTPRDERAALADQRTRFTVLATRSNTRDRRKAVELGEDLARRSQFSSEDRFLLAKLYESIGEWSKAQQQFILVMGELEKRLDGKKTDQRLVNHYKDRLGLFCASLIKEGQLNHAELYLAKLKNLEPKSFRTVALRAQLSFKQKRSETAVAELLALAQDNDKLAENVALVLERIDQPKAAEELLRKLVARAKRPGAPLVLAEFLGRQERIKEALDVCEQVLKDGKVEPVANAAVTILYAAKEVNEAECQRAARWIQMGIDQGEKPGLLTTHLAAIHRLRKDYSQTIGLYRRLIKENVNDVLVLNNLAWLLALSERNGTEALQIIDRAIDLEGPQGEFLDTRAVVQLVLGNAKQAVEDLKDAIADTPTAQRYFHLAQAQFLAGSLADAREAFRNAKTRGLSESTIDPLELTTYHQLRIELDTDSPSRR